MKTTRIHTGMSLGMAALGSLLLIPALQAETAGGPPPRERPAAAERARENDRAPNERMQQARRRMAELQKAGKPEEARQLARRIEAERGKSQAEASKESPRSVKKPPMAKENAMPPVAKIRHLREAAEHLQMAGYEKQADMAREEAGRIEADVKRHQPQSDRPADPAAAMRAEIMTLRSEMEKLRGEVRRLMAAQGPRPGPPGPMPGARMGRGR